VTFTLRLAGEVVPLRLRAIDTAPANSTVVVTAEFDLPESAPAGTTTVELECWAQDAELLATAVGAVTVAAATLPWFLGVISLVVLLVVIALALVHARRTRRPPSPVDASVRVEPRSVAAEISVRDLGTERSHAVRLAAHLDSGTHDVEEVAR
jgi:hypothetical protein